MLSHLNYLSTCQGKFFDNPDEFSHKFWIESLIFFFLNKFHYNSFNKTIYNQLNRETHFMTQGVLLYEFLHILYDSKVHHENFFISLYVSQRHFEWCKVEQNETIFFLYLDWNFFFFQKKLSIEKPFFFSQKENFSILTLKAWNLFEKMRLTSKIFVHTFKSFRGHLEVIEKQKWARGLKNGLF